MLVFDRAPVYLCSRSADVILSDIRPMKLKLDALKSINVLFDELLWLVLSAARSLSTDKLKNGLLKILPTPLGKEALLEAEVELRAYLERDPSMAALYVSDSTLDEEKFSIYPVFELMRIKCEAYSTLNDGKENAEIGECGRIEQLFQGLGFSPTMVVPAALYLTAILESICERILSNISRVTARDSSRTTATIDDLFVALCEDENIYSLFKSMKVYNQIEIATQSLRPRHSKSISRNGCSLASSRGLSPPLEIHDTGEAHSLPSNNYRMSSDSPTSNLQLSARGVTQGNSRLSVEEFTTTRQQSASVSSDFNKRKLSSSDEKPQIIPSIFEEETLRDFDDMMRSGSTMKVSLTPDRLKTFETYARDKTQLNRSISLSSASLTIRPDANPASQVSNDSSSVNITEDVHIDKVVTSPTDYSHHHSRRVDSISEPEQNAVRGPPRKISLSSNQPNVTHRLIPAQYSRLRSASTVQPPRTQPAISRKASLSISPVSWVDVTTQEEPTLKMDNSGNVIFGTKLDSSGVPKLDLELNDILRIDSEEEGSSSKRISPFTPKSARPPENGISDLVNFLKEGPPRSPDSSSNMILSLDIKSRPGRLRNIVSKLTRGSSTEKFVIRVNNDEYLNRLRGPTILPSTVAYTPPPISIKKSLHNFSGQTGIISPTLPISPPSSPSHDDHYLRRNNSLLIEPNSEMLLQTDLLSPLRETMNQAYGNHQKQEEFPTNTTTNITDQYSQKSSTILTAKSHLSAISSSTRCLLGRLQEHVEDIRGAVSNASTVDECRLLLELYLAPQDLQLEMPTSVYSTMSRCMSDMYETSLTEILLSTVG